MRKLRRGSFDFELLIARRRKAALRALLSADTILAGRRSPKQLVSLFYSILPSRRKSRTQPGSCCRQTARMFPGAFLALVCVLSVATAQPLPESVFKQLSAQELRVLELAQNPKLLELAARTGERVVVNIAGPSQGSVVQDGVNVVLNCLPWLMNFPGGSIRWYFSKYDGVDHTSLGPRMPQNRQDLLTNPIRKITGEFDEIYNITRTRIQQNAADPGRGIYECEVCIQRGTIFEQCHSANTSLIIAGRKPLLNSTTGRSESQCTYTMI